MKARFSRSTYYYFYKNGSVVGEGEASGEDPIFIEQIIDGITPGTVIAVKATNPAPAIESPLDSAQVLIQS